MSNNKYLYWTTFVAINGGLLFGLNMAGISGAVDMIKGQFSLTDSSSTFNYRMSDWSSVYREFYGKIRT